MLSHAMTVGELKKVLEELPNHVFLVIEIEHDGDLLGKRNVQYDVIDTDLIWDSREESNVLRLVWG